MGDSKTWVSSVTKLLGYEGEQDSMGGGLYFLAILTTFVGLSFGCVVTILFLGADCWRAFKQRKHWIPGDSLIFGALAMQLLTLVNKPSSTFSYYEKSKNTPLQYACEYLNVIHGEWILILVGRVSTCVLMGCLLPGVATPLSPTLRTDMASLFISFALVSVYITSHELFILPTASELPGYIEFWVSSNVYRCPKYMWNTIFMELTNVIVLVSMITLALLLGCAALASIGIHQIVTRKIPLLLSALKPSPRLYPTNVLWLKIEEQVIKSWIVVRTSNPQYIISRSILSSSVAFIITICNAVLVFEMARCSYKTTLFASKEFFFVNNLKANTFHRGCIRPPASIPLILRYMTIFLGSAVIYCRCVTAAVYYPGDLSSKLRSGRQFWHIEVFWISHLLDLIDNSKRQRRGIARHLRCVRLHKLFFLIVWLQMSLVFFSKGCWILSQLLFSNKFFGKLVLGSASERLNGLYREGATPETQLEQDPVYAKYKEVCVTMQGENSVGLWVANKTSVEELIKRFQKGEEEGNRCNELIALINDKCSANFSGQSCLKPSHPLGFEVESDLNVHQCSPKMTAVSILELIFELSPFIHNREGKPKDMTDRSMKACYEAWNIMDVVEYSDSVAAGLITTSDELLEKLEKERKWPDHRLPVSNPVDKSPEAAKAAVENMFERGKEVANAYESRAWEDIAAAYSMCRLCRLVTNDCDFNSVEEVVDGLEGVLADVMGSCIAKAGQVIAEHCKKWATKLEEERIWKAAKVVGKVKAIMKKTGFILEAIPRSDIDQSAAGNGKHYFKRYEKFPTMTT